MTFLSYAQNCEDVLLWRALGHIKNGFYIDVGANDPVEHSVTRAFYDAGWHGINIEPLPAFHQQFLDQRPRDINLAIAAGASNGSVTLFDVPAVNGWASPDAAVAAAHRADGHAVTELLVPMRTLVSVWDEHVRGEVHFLKIDVEGFEGEVVRGMDFSRLRPWVLVIEATLPNSRVSNHAQWEALITQHRYTFAHFDGLNRYYVAAEHGELAEVLAIQPNVFDNYISWHLDRAWKATERTKVDLGKASARAAHAEQQRARAEQGAEQAHGVASQALAQSADLLARYDDAVRQTALAIAEREQLRLRLERRGDELDALGVRIAEMDKAAAAAARTAAQALVDAAAAAQAQAEAADDAARARDSLFQASQAELQSRHQAQLIEFNERARALQEQLASRERALDELGAASHRTSEWGRDLETRLLATYASTSWKVTAPLRWLGALPRRLRSPETRAAARAALRRVAVRFTASERMRRLFIPLLLRFPEQAAQVQQVLRDIKHPEPVAAAAPPVAAQMSDEERAMPAAARKVLADLQRARRHTTGN